jgi:hypothetical protein
VDAPAQHFPIYKIVVNFEDITGSKIPSIREEGLIFPRPQQGFAGEEKIQPDCECAATRPWRVKKSIVGAVIKF